jgi:hypothetical protein
MEENNNPDVKVLTTILEALKTLDVDAQKRTLQAISTFLGITEIAESKSHKAGHSSHPGVSFSENRDMTAKEFLREKLPQTDVERMTCLAYYLTHYRSIPHFKSLDVSTLNTEAAQPKFSNVGVTLSNAQRAGLIVAVSKGNNQISSAGEVFVQALPDREAAKAAIKNMRIKKRFKKGASKKSD